MSLGKVIAGVAAVLVAGETVYAVASGKSSLLRPPGIQSEADFMQRCIKCGKCVEACKYKAIHVADLAQGAADGTPYINPETQACKLCEDFPCVAACPTDALRNVATRTDVHMGYAELNDELCIALKGLRCEVCYRVCPLIDKAITLQFDSLEDDDIHTKFVPTVNQDVCTGCGLCVQRCAVRDPKVAIRIVTLGEQEK